MNTFTVGLIAFVIVIILLLAAYYVVGLMLEEDERKEIVEPDFNDSEIRWLDRSGS